MLKNRIRTCLLLLAICICVDSALLYHVRKDNKATQPATDQEWIWKDLTCFPIPISTSDSDLTISFVDTWNTSRNYGGDRVHEGCDIITSIDEPGVYPVLSMTDGTVEKIGWLELGGYRVGIRSKNGLYLYYAHLESYAPDLKQGDTVYAGECIGFVGDTGYGEEGTTGQFVSHLHVGVYTPDGESDVAINPYPYLLELQNNQLKYEFQEP